MIRNLKFELKNIIDEEAIALFFEEKSDKIIHIVRCVEKMIQEFTGVIIMPTEISFISDNTSEFLYTPIIEIKNQDLIDHMTWSTTYTCGVLKPNDYIMPILFISKHIYNNDRLLTIEEIKQYAIWFPNRKNI